MDATTGHPVGGLLGVLRKGLHLRPGRSPRREVRADDGVPAREPQPHRGGRGCRLGASPRPASGAFRHGDQRTIDVVLTANGLPVVTMELKTDNTQTVNHAIRQ